MATQRTYKEIVIHCSATREDKDYAFSDLKRDHLARGFREIGYHFYITKDGVIYTGRDIKQIGAHVQGHNAYTIGICYEGGLDSKGKPKDTRTQEQKNSIVDLMGILCSNYPTIKAIKGHRDYSPDLNDNGIIEPNEWIKVCPCFDAKKEYKNFIKEL